MAENIKGITVSIGGDTTGLDRALKDVNKEIGTTQTELKKVERLLKMDPTNTDLLAQKQKLLSKAIGETKNKVDVLKNAKKQADNQMKNGTEVNEQGYRALQREIAETENRLKSLNTQSKTTNNIVSKIGEGFKGVGKGLATTAGVVTKGIGAIGAVAGTAVTGMLALEQSTREYRTDLSKLETNTNQAGLNFEKMKDNLTGLVALTDETDSSIEALSNLMQTGFNDAQIEQALDSLSGAIIAFPDTLKIESLADGLQETLATGEATGQFAELLERSGMSLDVFNEGLQKATKRGKEQEYILEQLAKTGMADVNKAYKEANKNLLTIKEAQQEVTNSMAELTKILEPLIANLMSFGAELFKILTQGYQNGGLQGLSEAIGVALTEILNKIVQNMPQVMQMGMQIISTLITSIIAMLPQFVEMGIAMIKELANGITESLPELIPIIIDVMLEIVDTLIKNIDMLVECALELVIALADGIIEALPKITDKVPEIIVALVGAILKNLPQLLDAGMQLIQKLWEGAISVWEKVLNTIGTVIWTYVLNPIKEKVSEFKAIGKNLIEGLAQGILNAKDWLINKVKELCNNCIKSIKSFFGIKSPSRVMRDEVGQFLTMGLGEGILKGQKYVIKANEKINQSIIDELNNLNTQLEKIESDELKRQTEKEIVEHKKAIEKKYEEYANAERKQKQKILEEIAQLENEWNEKQAKKETEALKEKLKEQINTIETFKKEYEEALDEIEAKEDTLADKMKNYGTLFSKVEVEGDTIFEIADIKEDIDAINSYGEALDKLKEKEIPNTLMREILDMNVEDAITYTNELLKKTDEEYAYYIELWNEKQRLAEEIAKNFYKVEFEALQNEFVDKLPQELSGIKEKMKYLGQLSAQGLGDGFSSQYSYIQAKMLETLQSAYNCAKEAMDIHSPSKLYAKLGTYMAEGIGVGFENGMNGILEGMKTKLESAVGLLQTDFNLNDVNIKGHTLVSKNENIIKNYTNTIETIRQPSNIELVLNDKKIARAIIPALNDEYVRMGARI